MPGPASGSRLSWEIQQHIVRLSISPAQQKTASGVFAIDDVGLLVAPADKVLVAT
jgi:hypothetical protein